MSSLRVLGTEIDLLLLSKLPSCTSGTYIPVKRRKTKYSEPQEVGTVMICAGIPNTLP